MGPAELPTITEVKRRLTGPAKSFSCRVVDRQPQRLVVLFISTTAVPVHDLVLPIGTVTFGYFWPDRAYNVYHWMSPAGATLAFYVNLADDTSFTEENLLWRDLAIDILMTPARTIVLDEHELPSALDEETRQRIGRAQREVLDQAATIRDEIDAASTALWPRVFGEKRTP